jgi:hypothetical protein
MIPGQSNSPSGSERSSEEEEMLTEEEEEINTEEEEETHAMMDVLEARSKMEVLVYASERLTIDWKNWNVKAKDNRRKMIGENDRKDDINLIKTCFHELLMRTDYYGTDELQFFISDLRDVPCEDCNRLYNELIQELCEYIAEFGRRKGWMIEDWNGL